MRVRPSSPAFTLLLGALAALPPLSIDMGLPSLPAIAAAFATSTWAAGLTLSLFMLGYALSQAVAGPLSDRLGRRPVLLAGLVLYAAAGLACAAAPTIATLLAARVLQGIGAACGPVLAFAIVRDTHEGQEGRAKLSYVTMVLSVAPIVAPTLGGWTLALGGWRAIHAVLGVTGLLVAGAVAIGLDETRRPQPRLASVRASPVLASYVRVLRERRTMAYAAVNALAFAGLFAFIGGSPLVLIGSMGVSIQGFGLLFALAACGLVLGSWVNGRLATRGVAPLHPLRFGLGVALVAAVIPSLLAWRGLLTPGVLIAFMLAATTCRGLVNPNAIHAAMERLPQAAGAVSAIVGCLQTLAAAVAQASVALLHPALGPLAMTGVMTVATLGAIVTLGLTARWRR